jgi:hypothetical protein
MSKQEMRELEYPALINTRWQKQLRKIAAQKKQKGPPEIRRASLHQFCLAMAVAAASTV